MSEQETTLTTDHWPSEVPVLPADDIHKGNYNGPGGRHCIAGWNWKEFGHADQGERVLRVLGAMLPDLPVRYNDDPSTPKADIARTWNRAMALCGYVVGNPEARWAARNRRRFARVLKGVPQYRAETGGAR